MVLLMILLVVANASNTLNPVQGFSLTVGPSISKGEIHTDELHHIFSEWVKSGNPTPPLLLKNRLMNVLGFILKKLLIVGFCL